MYGNVSPWLLKSQVKLTERQKSQSPKVLRKQEKMLKEIEKIEKQTEIENEYLLLHTSLACIAPSFEVTYI